MQAPSYDLTGFPRTRGDGPAARAERDRAAAVPPHPRGWSPRRAGSRHRRTGSPAPAGMVPGGRLKRVGLRRFPRTRGDGPGARRTPSRSWRVPPHPRGWSTQRSAPFGHRLRFPRTRGDGPLARAMADAEMVVPPHPRGWSHYERVLPVAVEGSPAPAGMVRIVHVRLGVERGFPRTRGDGPLGAAVSTFKVQVPPHPRGWSPQWRRGR